MLWWKIFFWDERAQEVVTATNLTASTRADGMLILPRLPVLLIVNILRDQPRPRAVQAFGRNYYLLKKNSWAAASLSGLHNYIDDYTGNACILRGAMAENDVFAHWMRESLKDPEVLQAAVDIFSTDEDTD